MSQSPDQRSRAGTHSNTTANPSRKRLVAYAVTERETSDGTKTFWTRIGVAFDNRDGSTTIKLEAFPVSGVIQVRDDEADQRRKGAGNAPF